MPVKKRAKTRQKPKKDAKRRKKPKKRALFALTHFNIRALNRRFGPKNADSLPKKADLGGFRERPFYWSI